MWDQGGGFMTSSTPGSAARTPGGGGRRAHRAQNVVAVALASIVNSSEETLKVEGLDVGMVVVVAQVRSVDLQATKSVYTIEDDTASIQAVHFKDEGQEHVAPSVTENMYCRVVGVVSHSADNKHLMVHRIDPIEDRAEMDAHRLQIVHDRLKIRLATEKENALINGQGNVANGGSVSASLLATGNGGGVNNALSGGSGSVSFGKAQYDAVFKLISGCPRDEGLSREELVSQLKGRFSRTEIEASLDYLSGEGHIYLTIDEDHFKAID